MNFPLILCAGQPLGKRGCRADCEVVAVQIPRVRARAHRYSSCILRVGKSCAPRMLLLGRVIRFRRAQAVWPMFLPCSGVLESRGSRRCCIYSFPQWRAGVTQKGSCRAHSISTNHTLGASAVHKGVRRASGVQGVHACGTRPASRGTRHTQPGGGARATAVRPRTRRDAAATVKRSRLSFLFRPPPKLDASARALASSGFRQRACGAERRRQLRRWSGVLRSSCAHVCPISTTSVVRLMTCAMAGESAKSSVA